MSKQSIMNGVHIVVPHMGRVKMLHKNNDKFITVVFTIQGHVNGGSSILHI